MCIDPAIKHVEICIKIGDTMLDFIVTANHLKYFLRLFSERGLQ